MRMRGIFPIEVEGLLFGASIYYVDKQGGGVSQMSTILHKLM